MAMGTRQSEQGSMWVAMAKLPKSPGHPFYARLSALLDAADFDRFVEEQCAKFYAPVMGRPSLAPGRYFRLLLVGYFEGIDSERGIAWRASDSLACAVFCGCRWKSRPRIIRRFPGRGAPSTSRPTARCSRGCKSGWWRDCSRVKPSRLTPPSARRKPRTEIGNIQGIPMRRSRR